MDSVYKHTGLHNDPMVAAQLREVRIVATSTVGGADSTRKRVRASSASHSAKPCKITPYRKGDRVRVIDRLSCTV